jgi:hypothetical protein
LRRPPEGARACAGSKAAFDFYYEGKSYEFNFSKFWNNLPPLSLPQRDDRRSISGTFVRKPQPREGGEIRSSTKDKLLINYKRNGKSCTTALDGGNGSG